MQVKTLCLDLETPLVLTLAAAVFPLMVMSDMASAEPYTTLKKRCFCAAPTYSGQNPAACFGLARVLRNGYQQE
jgi:hypothetical protein